MKKVFIFLAAVCAISACDRTKTPVTPQEDPNWIKLEVPNGRSAYAIVGDIEKTLLVTTWTKAYYSIDRGKTWQESKDFSGPVAGLLVQADTIFSMQGRFFDPSRNLLSSSLIQYFTTDHGKTWNRYQKTKNAIKPIGWAQAPEGVEYTIKRNSTPLAPGSTTAYVNPGEILKTDRLSQRLMDIPFKHDLTNLHLDEQGRLYVTVSGTHQPEKNTIFCCSEDQPAVIYVSKHPLP